MSEEMDSGNSGNGFSRIVEGLLKAGVTAWRKYVLTPTRRRVYILIFRNAKLVIPVIVYFPTNAVGSTLNFPAEYEMHLVDAIGRIGLERSSQTIG